MYFEAFVSFSFLFSVKIVKDPLTAVIFANDPLQLFSFIPTTSSLLLFVISTTIVSNKTVSACFTFKLKRKRFSYPLLAFFLLSLSRLFFILFLLSTDDHGWENGDIIIPSAVPHSFFSPSIRRHVRSLYQIFSKNFDKKKVLCCP